MVFFDSTNLHFSHGWSKPSFSPTNSFLAQINFTLVLFSRENAPYVSYKRSRLPFYSSTAWTFIFATNDLYAQHIFSSHNPSLFAQAKLTLIIYLGKMSTCLRYKTTTPSFHSCEKEPWVFAQTKQTLIWSLDNMSLHFPLKRSIHSLYFLTPRIFISHTNEVNPIFLFWQREHIFSLQTN